MNFNYKQFHVSIYGDGKHEYDGYYLVVVDEFDAWDNPTQRKKVLYIKSKSIEEVKEFICHITDENFLRAFGNNEKLHIVKQWCVTTEGE